MFLGQIHSPANPMQGSAFSTYGLKPSENEVVFSVGDQCGDDSYITKDSSGNLPTFTIESGILTFSYPQTHSYIGVGDIIFWSGGSVYISKKLSTRRWRVKNADGSAPNNISTAVVVQKIDKAYNTILNALSDIPVRIGNKNLVSRYISVGIACYKKTSYNSGEISITGWTTSATNYIRIFAPRNVSNECNKAQIFTITSNAASALITCSNDYIIIDALRLEESGACNIGIDVAGIGIISNCRIHGFQTHGIRVTESVDNVILSKNILYNGNSIGIEASNSSKVIHNTVYGYPTGYNFTGSGANCFNCIAANNTPTQGFVNIPSIFDYCASDDATAVGTHSVPNANIKFIDPANGDFRLTNANNENIIRNGLDLRSYQFYNVIVDESNNLIDNTVSMGAIHFVPTVPFAIGNTAIDLKTGSPNFTIHNGIIEFDIAQINELLSAGCVVNPGINNIILLERIDNTHWRTTLHTGLAPSNQGTTAVISIKFAENNFKNFCIAHNADNLPNLDIKVNVLIVNPTNSNGSSLNIITDQTRTINIYAPYLESDCNSRRRHSGVWSAHIPRIENIEINTDYACIAGLQIGGNIELSGISYNSDIGTVIIEENIIKESLKGIYLNRLGKSRVFNNVIYDCDEYGIAFMDSSGTTDPFDSFLANNTVYCCGGGISIDYIKPIRLLNNILINNQYDLLCDAPKADWITTESNWTSDSSALKLESFHNNEPFKTVLFAGRRNFHIPLAQHLLMITGYQASSDHIYQPTLDIDSIARPENKRWDLGADQYSLPDKKCAIFSVGANALDLQNTPGISVHIVDSIAKFAQPLDSSIGIGDKVTLQDASVYYLAEKGNSETWRVVDNTGSNVSDHSGTLDTIKRVANTLADAVSLPHGKVSENFGGSDLVAKSADIKIECYQDGIAHDDAPVFISGWTTSSLYRMTIESPYNISTQCGRRQRHVGVWNNNYYHLNVPDNALTIDNNNIDIDGLQIDANEHIGCNFISANNCSIKRCIIKNVSIGVEQNSATFDIYVQANIIYYSTIIGIHLLSGYANNNTVIGTSGYSYSTGLASSANMVNNIANGTANGYTGSAVLYSCISQDSSAGTANGCKSNVDLDFLGPTDFHLARDDFEALNYGINNAYNPDYDIDSEEIVEYSIGADCRNDEPISVYFSQGQTASSFAPPSTFVTIKGNVATFSKNLSDKKIMKGNKLVYNGTMIAYLLEKLSENSWLVVDKIGGVPTAASSAPVNSITHPFNNLNKIFDINDAKSIAQFYGNSTNKFISLAKARLQINIVVSGESSNFTDSVTIAHYETNQYGYFRLYAPYLKTECNFRQKHAGIDTYPSNDTHACIRYAGSSIGNGVVDINCDYTVIDGLIITGTPGISCVYARAAHCKIINNIIYNGKYGIISLPNNLRNIIVNNIVFNIIQSGILSSNYDFIYNNTVYGAKICINMPSFNSICRNNIAQSASENCFEVAGGIPAANADYCIASDNTLPNNGTNLLNQIVHFINPSGRNFNLKKTDPRGTGINLGGDLHYSFLTDAIENVRGRFWDCGALEYQPENVAYFSVGTESEYQNNSGNLKINIDSNSIGTFSEPQINNKIASGDAVVGLNGVVICYLAEKINTKQWKVKGANGKNIASSYNTSVVKIRRAFTTLSSLVSQIDTPSYLGSKNLVTTEVQLNIVISNDAWSTQEEGGVFSGYTTDNDYCIKLFSPYDTTKHCNESMRHKGTYKSGARIISKSSYVIKFNNVDFAEISGIVMESTGVLGQAVILNNSFNFLVEANIIRNCAGGAIIHSGVGASKKINNIVNNILYNCYLKGIDIDGGNDNQTWVMNNTVVKCGNGIHHIKGSTGGSKLYAYNNICQESFFKDFSEDNPSNSGKFILYYNISSDTSLNNFNNNINKTTLTFVDKNDENFFLDGSLDFVAIDSALNMGGISPYYFNTDARNVERDNQLWDRGAIERNDIMGHGDMRLGPLIMKNQNGIISNIFPTIVLYLRLPGDEYDFAPAYVQFNDIASLNAYLATNVIDNIIIYVESKKDGSASFTGTFELQNRGNRTVKIQTDPLEMENGPAKIIYNSVDGIVDESSVNGGVTFENIKIFSDASYTAPYLINVGSQIKNLTFINCIIQVNKNSLINTPLCHIKLINTICIYLNKDNINYIYIALNNSITSHIIYNSIFLVEKTYNINMRVTSENFDNYVYNCLTFNLISYYNLNIEAPGRKILCIENKNPNFTELEYEWDTLTPEQILESKFNPILESPLINAGNDNIILMYNIDTDILGNDRIFGFYGVDIGPYETKIHIMDIVSSDIRSIEQIKIYIDRIKKTLISTDNNIVYNSLYEIFQYRQEELEEFLREEKIAIELKTTNKKYVPRSDKTHQLIAEFEAYFDSKTNSIIVSKTGGEPDKMLGKILMDDSYILHFDELKHKLYLYLNELSTFGTSGVNNPVRNVRFGGNPIFDG